MLRLERMVKQIQLDWFDTYMRVGITRRFVPYSETIATLAGLKAENVRVLVMEVKQGGYVIHTKE